MCSLPSCSLLYRGEGQVKYCRATFFFFFSIVFYRPPPLSIFHPPPIFSCPSSRSPPISAVAFSFFCVLDVFPPLLSLLTLPWPVPSPDGKRGGLGVGLAPPPRKKKRLLQKRRQKIQRLQSWKRRVLRFEDL